MSPPPGARAMGDEAGPSPLALLFTPDRAIDRQARAGRARGLFLLAWLCAIALGAALATRVDARASTLRALDKDGQLQTMSDRQIAEETRNAERLSQVASVAKGVVGVPLQLGSASLALLGLAWFLRGRIKGQAVLPVAAATLLPGALAAAIDIATALRRTAIPDDALVLAPRSLSAILLSLGHPPGEPWAKLGNAFDFYSLWAAVILGFGVAAVGQLPRKRALPGTIIAWVCFRLLTHVAT